MSQVVLHQFASSHYNEKARWGLDWKGIPHERQSYLPGPHAFFIQRLSGQTATPVLCIDGRIVAGSAAILDTLEREYPERPLYPKDPALRRRALEIQEHFDAQVGPAVRTAVFSVLIDEPDAVVRTFAGSKPWLVQRLYRAAFPVARSRMAQANGTTDPKNIEHAFEISQEALDFVAREVGQSGFLVGDEFSVADLSCAALLAPLVRTGHPDMQRRPPVPERMEAFLERWASHPGAAWVVDRYARHRPAPLAS